MSFLDAPGSKTFKYYDFSRLSQPLTTKTAAVLLKMEVDAPATAAHADNDAMDTETLQIPELPQPEDKGHLYVFWIGPNLSTFTSAHSAEEALEKVQRPGHPHYNCTVEEINATIRCASVLNRGS